MVRSIMTRKKNTDQKNQTNTMRAENHAPKTKQKKGKSVTKKKAMKNPGIAPRPMKTVSTKNHAIIVLNMTMKIMKGLNQNTDLKLMMIMMIEKNLIILNHRNTMIRIIRNQSTDQKMMKSHGLSTDLATKMMNMSRKVIEEKKKTKKRK